MTDYSQTELAQTLFVEWMKQVKGLGTVTKEERLECFEETAQYAVEAAAEFAKALAEWEG